LVDLLETWLLFVLTVMATVNVRLRWWKMGKSGLELRRTVMMIDSANTASLAMRE
jgi:hypothetical protein